MKRIYSFGQHILAILLLLFLLQALVTNGVLGGFGQIMTVSLVGGVLVAAYFLLAQHPVTLIGIVMVVGGSYLWFFWSGLVPGWMWRDLIPDAVGIVACFMLVSWLFKKYQVNDPSQGGQIFVWALLSWLTISIVDWVRPHALPLQPQRFATAADTPRQWPQSMQVGLSLSGGGYRAAVYHSGVLAALDELGIPIATLSTVSGGSIVGAYYALGGRPADFPDHVTQGRFSLKRELLRFPNNPMVALPMSVPFTNVQLVPYLDVNRLDVQARLLRRLFSRGALAPELGAPRLLINATDLAYGFRVVFTDDGLILAPPNDSPLFFRAGDRLEVAQDLDLAMKVAISGAFPGAFPPTSYEIRVEPTMASGKGWRTLSLADGGVIDNLGANTLAIANRLIDDDSGMHPDLHSDILMVSDAGAVFDVGENLSSAAAALRSFDVGQAEKPEVNFDREEYLGKLIRFAAKDNFLTAKQRFMLDDDGRIQREIDSGDGKIKPSLSVYRLPEQILEKLIADLPAGLERDAGAALPNVRQAKKLYDAAETEIRKQLEFRQRYYDATECAAGVRAPGGEDPALFCAVGALGSHLQAGLIGYLRVFEEADTLKDYFSRADAQALHRLGRAMVFVQYPRIQRAMRAAHAAL